MGYTPHEMFDAPDPSDHLWRYMDFTKFVAMLENDALYFPRADLLGDPFEGSLSQKSVEQRMKAYKPGFATVEEAEEFVRGLVKHSHISCWHLSEIESAAMWRLYANRGVAICTNFHNLHTSLMTDYTVFIGRVSYIDYVVDAVPGDTTLSPSMCKRNSFEYEHEVRAIIQDFPRNYIDPRTMEVDVSGEGPPVLEIPCQLNVLLDSAMAVYVAPDEPIWFKELVESVCRRYGLVTPVLHSDLRRDPIY